MHNGIFCLCNVSEHIRYNKDNNDCRQKGLAIMYMLCEKNFKLTTIALCISFDWTLTNMSTSPGWGGGGGGGRHVRPAGVCFSGFLS